MTDENYRGDLLDRATSSESLQVRLKHNANLSARDFFSWHQNKLNVTEGMDVLDVGCGTGAQTLPLAELVGPKGSLSSIDISEDSIDELLSKVKGSNVKAIADNMMNLKQVIDTSFSVKKYDLAQSSYALYYADDPIKVLDIMRGSLKEMGRLAIFVPDTPHGMVDLAKKYSEVPKQVTDSLEFGRTCLEPYFRSNFWDVSVHLFHNELMMPDLDAFMEMYRATTYYDKNAESSISEYVQNVIAAEGGYKFEKNGYLIIGSEPFDSSVSE